MKINTLQNASIRYIVFKERGKWYAVALELNVVEEGDDPQEVLFSLFEAIRGYVVSARKANLPSRTLNQEPDEEYEKLWESAKTRNRKSTHVPLVYTFGERPLAIS